MAAAIWSPLIEQKQRVSNIMMHMVDVLPTLCAAAGRFFKVYSSKSFYFSFLLYFISTGIHVEDPHIDGINMWDELRKGSKDSPRTEFPYNIDPSGATNSSGAIRVGDWKYYKGKSCTTFLDFIP